MDKIDIKNYSNPAWEPVFADISPLLAKLYFRAKNGRVRYFIAGLIFRKLDWMEQRTFRER